jgi:flagellar motor switch protein FliM
LVALEEALVKLGKPRRFSAPRRPQTSDQRQRIGRSLGRADLPVVVTVGTTTLRLSEILALAVGDILVLDQGQSDPVSGSIEGRLRLLGKPGRVGRRLAMVVQQTLPLTEARTSVTGTGPAAAGKEAPHGR